MAGITGKLLRIFLRNDNIQEMTAAILHALYMSYPSLHDYNDHFQVIMNMLSPKHTHYAINAIQDLTINPHLHAMAFIQESHDLLILFPLRHPHRYSLL